MKPTNYITFLISIFILSSVLSCKKDEQENTTPVKFSATEGIYISNEGSFPNANSSITYYNPSSNYAITDVFKNANGQGPGNIAQSMSIINNKLYIVVNNSGKIEVCDLNTMERKATISGLTSPRYITQIDSAKAYVSDLYSNLISVVDLNTNTVTSTIQLNGWTEQMIVENNKVYVTNFSSEYLFVIDALSNAITDSILIGKGANSMVTDINGKLWVLCGSDYQGAFPGTLHRIDLVSSTVEQTFTFVLPDSPFDICINSAKDSICFINKHVYKMSINATILPASPIITSSQNNFYTLAIDHSKNEIYVGDAIDFAQNGRMYRYSADGILITSFLTGIGPGDIIEY